MSTKSQFICLPIMLAFLLCFSQSSARASPEDEGSQDPPVLTNALRINDVSEARRHLSNEPGGIMPDDLDAHPGDVLHQGRVDSIIARLRSETLEESFENAGHVNDFFYPGFYPESPIAPFEDIHRILSNRRFAKLFAALKDMSADEQYSYLSKYFNRFLREYRDIVEMYNMYRPDPVSDDTKVLIRISDIEGGPPTAEGTREALRMIALLSGALGNAKMWPIVREAFKEPICGESIDQSLYEPIVVEQYLKRRPAFPDSVRGQVAFLMGKYASDEEAAAVGFDKKAVMAAVPEKRVVEMEVVGYESRVTSYDVHFRMGDLPVDKAHGVYKISFLVLTEAYSDDGLMEPVVAAAMRNSAN